MRKFKIGTVFKHLHEQVERDLATARQALAHPTDKGDASESTWIELLSEYLPRRYVVSKAHVVDSRGKVSEQIDVVIHDRYYSPTVFAFKNKLFVPVESVYAVFEAKQEASSTTIKCAQTKAASVRRLHRSSAMVKTVKGPANREPQPILAGLLALSSSWNPPFGDAFKRQLDADLDGGILDIGCVASHGWFHRSTAGIASLEVAPTSATRFLFELMARLQEMANVVPIDFRAYARHIP